ncbi:MAG: hypothetical protein OFPI_01150 [Osedax symbiont Rs2]|nr:MAG: hypothetical protein OFPI_01150 [Osedax symbiont Rs2]
MINFIDFKNQRFHYLWLRDNCPCSDCRHPSGQRIHETWQLDANINVESYQVTDTGLQVKWAAPHQHLSNFTEQYLLENSYDRGRSTTQSIENWGSELTGQLPCFDYEEVIGKEEVKAQWLEAVNKYGLSLLKNVPTKPGTILQVVQLFGYVRNTNYGELFEVISVEQAVNLAFPPLPLSLHTDNPYRNPVPTLQLLHCLEKAQRGGVTALTDGFRAAQILREQNPEAFKLLASQAVTFRFSSEDAILEHSACMIETDARGEISAIRVNNRSLAPLNLPFDLMQSYYLAYQELMSIIQGSNCKVTLTLDKGDLILFDNQRILHGREVQAEGPRHLQGCYADRDGLRSTAALLKKQNSTTVPVVASS